MTRVRCYSGSRYGERPVAFEWAGAWLDVTEVTHRAATPEGLCFRVIAADGRRYRLAWREQQDEWTADIEEAGPGA